MEAEGTVEAQPPTPPTSSQVMEPAEDEHEPLDDAAAPPRDTAAASATSISLPATIIRSAISSTMTTI